jgi:hypothetical protein
LAGRTIIRRLFVAIAVLAATGIISDSVFVLVLSVLRIFGGCSCFGACQMI